jgi:cell division septation protein DedD
MKQALFVLIIISLTIFSCKTKKSLYQQPTETTPVEESVTGKAVEAEKQIDDSSIMVKTEEVSIADNEDKSKEGYAFYVIIGSFSKAENAIKFKNELIDKGFNPFLLNSETGFIRVAVGQSNDEKDARTVVLKIRGQHPEHKDVWLLKKK